MDPLSLYTETFRMILNLRSGVSNSWSPVYENFCKLRKSLLCGVCQNLTVVPYQRFTDHCSHNVCRDCLGGKLQDPCLWCAESKNFEDNVQIRIILQCFKNMCKFILSCGFFRNSLFTELSFPKLNFITMVNEGAKLADDYRYTSTHRIFGKKLKFLSNLELAKKSYGKKAFYRLHLSHKEYSKIMLDKAVLKKYIKEYRDSHFTGGLSSYVLQRCLLKRISCHCGVATEYPRRLTCHGQRCPCYIAGKSCFNCRCRGCKNPRVAPSRVYKFRAMRKTTPGSNGLQNHAATDPAVTNGNDN